MTRKNPETTLRQKVAPRSSSPKPLSAALASLTKPLLARYAPLEQKLLLDWATIIGPDYAAKTAPIGISFPKKDRRLGGVLTLWVDPSLAFVLEHAKPQILERINAYFGFGLLAGLRLKQTRFVVAQEPLPQEKPAFAPAFEEHLTQEAAGLQDENLREALIRLGRAVYDAEARGKDRRHKSLVKGKAHKEKS